MNLHLRNHFLMCFQASNIAEHLGIFPIRKCVERDCSSTRSYRENVIAAHRLNAMHDKMVLISIFSGSFQFRNADIEPCGIYTILHR
jgi:hypothetical protein